MKDLYRGLEHFYYRGGEYFYGESGWTYYQPTLSGGGMAPAANISYDAMHETLYHQDFSGNLRDRDGNIVATKSQVNSYRGNNRYGHWEKVTIENNGKIRGNKLNNPDDPNNIDEITVAEKWVWDVQQPSDWFRTLPDLDRNTISTLNTMSTVLGAVTTLAYVSGGPLVGGFVNSCLIYPAMGISTVTTMDTWGDYFRNPNPSQGDLIHVYVSTAVTIFGTIYWPISIPAGVYGIIDMNGKINWKKFDE